MIRLKSDKYKRARGGYSRLLDISCSKCAKHLCYYQKDGPGIIKRLYLDRISEPEFNRTKQLICPKCRQVLGVEYIYEKEKRPAIRIFVGALAKKIKKIA